MKQKSYDTSDPERYIEGIYSPGVNTSNLTYESNYLACIYVDTFKFHSTGRIGLSLGIAFIDVSTGENKLYETTSKNNDILHLKYLYIKFHHLLNIYVVLHCI